MGMIQKQNRFKFACWIIMSLLVSLSAQAQAQHEFENFQLTDPAGLNSSTLSPASQQMGLAAGSFQEDNPLYQQILDELGHQYEQIGQRQADQVLQQRDGFFVGGLNHIGFRWGKDFVNFRIEAHRQLAPDLFHDERWIVTDELVIEIDASQVLSNLRDQDIIDISEEQYAAFAGIKFQRRYRHAHFAESYSDGLVMHLDRLFLAFQAFRGRNYLDLEPYEYLKRTDSISISAGGMASSPLYQTGGVNLSASVGALIRYENLASVDIQSVGPSDQHIPGERLRISAEKSETTTVGVSASLQADFLKILRLTLLSFDFSYSLKETYQAHLRFFEDDLEVFEQDSPQSQALRDLLRLRKKEINVLARYRVSEEHRKTEEINSRYLIFFKGGMSDQETEHIKIASHNQEKTFFRHNYSRTMYEQGILSRIFTSFIRSFFRLPAMVQDNERDTKDMRMEYESERNLVQERGDLIVSDESDNLSIRLGVKYFAVDSRNGLRSRYSKRVQEVLGRQTGADPLAENLLQRSLLRGPVRVNASYELGKDAISHFNTLSSSRKYGLIDDMCGYRPRNIFFFFRNLFNFCRHRLKTAYEDYEVELHHRPVTQKDYQNCQARYRMLSRSRRTSMVQACMSQAARKTKAQAKNELPLWRLKDFVQKLHVESDDKVDYYNFFGLKNIFHYGDFSARTHDKQPFRTHFSEGKFHGLGIVEAHRQSQGLRSPASIELE